MIVGSGFTFRMKEKIVRYFGFAQEGISYKNTEERRVQKSKKSRKRYEHKICRGRSLRGPGNGNLDIYWMSAQVIEDLKQEKLK